MKTTVAKKEEQKQWYVVDAKDLVLGRLAVKIANVLRGRYKPTYTPNVDCGDHVIVINAEKIRVTGKKETDKEYMFYTGYVGGEKYVSLSEFRKRKRPLRTRPEHIFRRRLESIFCLRRSFSSLSRYYSSNQSCDWVTNSPLSLKPCAK